MNIPSWIIAAMAFVSAVNTLFIAWVVWSIKKIAKDKAEETVAPVSDAIEAVDHRLTGIEAAVKAMGPAIGSIPDLDKRQSRIEAAIEHLPDQEQWIETVAGMRELRAEMKVFGAKLEGADRLVDRLQQQVTVMDDFLRRVKT